MTPASTSRSASRGLAPLLGLTALLLPACGDSASDPGSAELVAGDATPAPAADSEAVELVSANPGTPAGRTGRPAGMDLPEEDPVLGSVLVINGEVIPHEIVRREIVRGSAGIVALELAKLSVFIEEEIERELAAGVDPARFKVTDEEVTEAIAEVEAQVKEEYADETVELKDLLPTGTQGLNDRVALTKLFNKVFLPRNPEEYPATTLAALNSNDQGKTLLQYLEQQYQENPAGDPDAPMIASLIFQQLTEYLNDTSDIQVGDSLPAGVAMRVNGTDILVEELWPRIVHRVSEAEVRQAKQWIVNIRLAREALEREGFWLSEGDAAERYAAHSDPYKESLFSQERIATVVKKYPSIDAYRRFRRVYDSFQDKIRSELNADDLRAFGQQRTRLLVGQSQIDADVILLSGYDFRENRWVENGWAEAEARAREVLRALVEEGRDWDEVLEEYSDFHDPPVSVQMSGPNPQAKNRGRFRGKQRNVLMSLIGESEYWQFLNGSTITDFVFFKQEVGTVAQPMKGPYGWYIAKLLRRGAAPERIDMDDETLITMAEQDYTLLRLAEYVQELIGENEVYGLN